jgi:putative redox protein
MAESDTISATLNWREGVVFDGVIPGLETTVDGDARLGASPMGHLLLALAGCMSIDIADILGKMRTPADEFSVAVVGTRPEDPPRRFQRVVMTVAITGDVPAKNVERAIRLSRERYCSVLHTLDPELQLDIDVELTPTPSA